MSGVDPNAGGVTVIPSGGGGGGTHGSGTLPLPASPSAGDTYAVTSGTGAGDRYLCTVAGTWEQIQPVDPIVSLGGSGGPSAGFASGEGLRIPGTIPAAPEFGPGQSLVVILYPVATPSAAEVIGCHFSSADDRGWMLRVGDDAGGRTRLSLYLLGLTSGAPYALMAGAAWAGLLNAPFAVAMTIKASDQTVHYAVNGVLQTPLAALPGTYAPPTSGDPFTLGVYRDGTSVPAASTQIVAWRHYSTELSDADLVVATAAFATYRIPTVTGTVSFDFHASDGPTRRARSLYAYAAGGSAVYARS